VYTGPRGFAKKPFGTFSAKSVDKRSAKSLDTSLPIANLRCLGKDIVEIIVSKIISGPVLTKSGPVLTKSGPVLIKSGPVLIKSGPVLTKSGPVYLFITGLRTCTKIAYFVRHKSRFVRCTFYVFCFLLYEVFLPLSGS
jgi:hypothetical protein